MTDHLDRKDDIVEMENMPSRLDNGVKAEEDQVVFDSKFAHMGFRETISKCRKVCLICMGIFVGALFDGESTTSFVLRHTS